MAKAMGCEICGKLVMQEGNVLNFVCSACRREGWQLREQGTVELGLLGDAAVSYADMRYGVRYPAVSAMADDAGPCEVARQRILGTKLSGDIRGWVTPRQHAWESVRQEAALRPRVELPARTITGKPPVDCKVLPAGDGATGDGAADGSHSGGIVGNIDCYHWAQTFFHWMFSVVDTFDPIGQDLTGNVHDYPASDTAKLFGSKPAKNPEAKNVGTLAEVAKENRAMAKPIKVPARVLRQSSARRTAIRKVTSRVVNKGWE